MKRLKLEDTEENKKKLLSILQSKSEDETKLKPVEKTKTSTVQKIINSPTPIKSLNVLFWILFIGIDIIVAFIAYIYWL